MSSQPHEEPHRAASYDASADERTLCEPASDDEGYDGRPSGELSEGDHDILESEDERERLLTQNDGITGMFGRKGSGVKIGKLSKKKVEMKEREKGRGEESSALMYKMEEGIGGSSSSLRSRRSSESDEQRLLAMRSQRKVCRIYPCADETDKVEDSKNTTMAADMHIHLDCRLIRCPLGRRIQSLNV